MSTTKGKEITNQKSQKVKISKAKSSKKDSVNFSIELSKIGAAYSEAIDGKIKFSEVKEMLKKLHKQVKKSVK